MHIPIILNTKFKLNSDFLEQICPKSLFLVENRRNEHLNWILHIHIILGTKFQLKLTILVFWTKFAQKEYLQSKIEKINITTEVWILELVEVPSFSLNWQFRFFGPNLPKKCIFSLKHWILQIQISQSSKLQVKLTVFIFWTKFMKK